MWCPDGDQEVSSCTTLYVLMNSSDVISAVPAIALIGAAIVFNILMVSGKRSIWLVSGVVSWSNKVACGESPCHRIAVVRGPEPNGVPRA